MFHKKVKVTLGFLCFLLQELGAEKSKVASLDARLKAELSAQVQKVDAMQARMETANQEHLNQTQKLNQKVQTIPTNSESFSGRSKEAFQGQ